MSVCIHWFRRDLRLEDNTALFHALQSGVPVLLVFILDSHILSELTVPGVLTLDKRLIFICDQLVVLQKKLRAFGSDLKVFYGDPVEVWQKIAGQYDIQSVYANHDYESYAISRDEQVYRFLSARKIAFHTYKDQCIFEKLEIAKDDGSPYTVFTPYSKKWLNTLSEKHLLEFDISGLTSRFFRPETLSEIPDLESIGFKYVKVHFPPCNLDEYTLTRYADARDFPAKDGTSRIGVHLRFGTISIRSCVRKALQLGASVFLKELIWREFYMMILASFPHVVSRSFKEEYDRIVWKNDERLFDLWCAGETGYPIVDAGMRELNATGYMHNRVRMIAASFLTKHLLTDWRWGEAYFARKLLDFELASNNGGWQWAAGSGCDAAPYFRVFNPEIQAKKFDPEGIYIRQWVPEIGSSGYPEPVVEHRFARQRAIDAYKLALKGVV